MRGEKKGGGGREGGKEKGHRREYMSSATELANDE